MKFLLIRQKISKFVIRSVLVKREMNIKKLIRCQKILSCWYRMFFKRFFLEIKVISTHRKNYISKIGYSHVGDTVILMTESLCWWLFQWKASVIKMLNRSQRYQNCHQRKPSPTFVTNINVANFSHIKKTLHCIILGIIRYFFDNW